MTVYRARIELGYEEPHDSSVTDVDVKHLVSTVKEEMPNVGEKMLHGILKSRGVRVTRRRFRQVIHSVDPFNTVLRWRAPISRRPYSVRGPKALVACGR